MVSLMEEYKKAVLTSIVEISKISDAAIPYKILIVLADAVSANVSK